MSGGNILHPYTFREEHSNLLTRDNDVKRRLSVDHFRVDVKTARFTGHHDATQTFSSRCRLAAVNHRNRERTTCQSNTHLSINHVPANQTRTCQSNHAPVNQTRTYHSITHLSINHAPVNQSPTCQSTTHLSINHVPAN